MLRIVIADDEVLLTISLRAQLENHGFAVVGVARNGSEAVALVRRERPDIVLTDSRMPVMDGFEATRHIMAENPTCVLIVTALPAGEASVQAEASGAMGCLSKPISVDEAAQAIELARQRFAERFPTLGDGRVMPDDVAREAEP